MAENIIIPEDGGIQEIMNHSFFPNNCIFWNFFEWVFKLMTNTRNESFQMTSIKKQLYFIYTTESSRFLSFSQDAVSDSFSYAFC